MEEEIYINNEDGIASEPVFEIPPQQMILEASGKNEHGLPKTKVGLFYQIIQGDQTIDKLECTCLDPIIKINKNFSKITVDIIFATKNNAYFATMNDLMRAAYAPDASITDEQQPLVTLVLIPDKYQGKFYMLGSDPAFWCITAQNPREDLDTLRLVFEDYNFFFLKNEDDVLLEVSREIKAEEEAEEKKAEYYAQKEAERRNG